MRLLVVNAGSSSTKCSVIDGEATVLRRQLPGPASDQTKQAIDELLARHEPEATVHRIVHGGERWRRAVVVDAEVEADLATLNELAPLHNPVGLALLDHVRRSAPRLPTVACFDTAFFADLPDDAARYAIPEDWRQHLGIRRFGFHGLSHAWAAKRVAELIGLASRDLRIVTAHLGSGASLAAIDRGRPVDTTMGYTPLDGLVMATRPGSLDPGIVTAVARHTGWTPDEIDQRLERRCGLLALAGTPDLAEVIRRSNRGDPVAVSAYGVYLHRLRGAIGAMCATMGGVDALVFTGGAGEASAELRAAACDRLGFLGLQVDPTQNERSGDRLVSPRNLPGVAVVAAREDLEMAEQAQAALTRRARRRP